MAKLPAEVATKEDIPEGAESFYSEVEGGGFALETDSTDRLKEFRTNNIGLLKKAEDLESRLAGFEGIDPEEYKKLKSAAAKKKEDGLKPDDFDAYFEEKAKPLRDELEAEKAKNGSLSGELTRRDEEGAIQKEAASLIKPEAMTDLMGRSPFKWDGEKMVRKDAEGKTVYGKDGPQTITEWLAELADTAPHLFKESKGGTGKHGAGGAGSTKHADMTPAEKAAYISKNGQEAYLKLAGLAA